MARPCARLRAPHREAELATLSGWLRHTWAAGGAALAAAWQAARRGSRVAPLVPAGPDGSSSGATECGDGQAAQHQRQPRGSEPGRAPDEAQQHTQEQQCQQGQQGQQQQQRQYAWLQQQQYHDEDAVVVCSMAAAPPQRAAAAKHVSAFGQAHAADACAT
jgi:hypothetical protein